MSVDRIPGPVSQSPALPSCSASDSAIRLLATSKAFVSSAAREHEPTGRGAFGTAQLVHWGLELALKAYLHHRGWSDVRCAAEIRHDIVNALHACEHEGLPAIAPASREVIKAIRPLARRQTLDRADLPERRELIRVGCEMIRSIEREIGSHTG